MHFWIVKNSYPSLQTLRPTPPHLTPKASWRLQGRRHDVNVVAKIENSLCRPLGNEIVPKLCLVNGIKISRLLLARFRGNTWAMKSTRTALVLAKARFQSFQKNLSEKTKMIQYFIRTQLSTNGGWLHNLHLYFLSQVILENEKILKY